MALPTFDELPFNSRPDLTPYLLHLTKNTRREDDFTAFENLVNILETGKIWGSSTKRGFIKGKHRAACFMDVPFASLKYLLTPENADPQNPRYEPYGIVITKRTAYRRGCRPVVYMSNAELQASGIVPDELWRVVRLEKQGRGWINWVHEREWRCKGALVLPKRIQAVMVRTTREAHKLTKLLHRDPKSFRCRPRSVLPLTVLSQGLLRQPE